MEWTFGTVVNGTRQYSDSCPENKVRDLTSHFVKNGFRPYDETLREANPEQNLTWFGNVVWIHNDAKNVTLIK